MKVSTSTPDRFGVYTRVRGAAWTLVVHAGDRAAAERLMIDLAAEARHSADWAVRALADPPEADTTPCQRSG